MNAPGNGNNKPSVTVLSPFHMPHDRQMRQKLLDNIQEEVKKRLKNIGTISEPRIMLDIPPIGKILVKCSDVPFLATDPALTVHIEEPPSPHDPPKKEEREESSFFSEIRTLPDPSFNEYWERIFIPSSLKETMVRHFLNWRRLKARGLDSFSMARSGIIMLEGPPGTGKTSICRGIAQQLAFRLGEHIRFVEIDAHRLSDEMLGKGPKFVQQAFRQIQQWVQEGPTFCVINEVESLTTCRKLASHDGNPVDVFRSVNAAIQCIDETGASGDLMMMCTSNLKENIDAAWMSRMDLSLHIGLPDADSRCLILADTIGHLNQALGGEGLAVPSEGLIRATEGLSGRALRKLIMAALLDLDQETVETSIAQITERAEQLAIEYHND